MKVTASKGRMQTGSASFALAISTHCPSRSSSASSVRSAGSHQPQVLDPFAGIDGTLAVQVELARRGGEHLAYPVRRQGDVGRVGIVGHPLPAPPRQVRHQDVLVEMQLRLVDDPPPARTAAALAEGAYQLIAQIRARQRMRHGGPRLGVELPIDDLGHPIRRGVEHVLVGGPGRRFGLAAPRRRTGAAHRPLMCAGRDAFVSIALIPP